MSKLCCSTLTIILCLAVGSCSPPLPNSYGVYAREGRTLIDLTDNEASDDWGLADDVAILVFQRQLSESGFTPDRQLTLQKIAYARSEQIQELRTGGDLAQTLLNRGPGNVSVEEAAALPVGKQTASPRFQWITIGNPIAVRYEPVPDRNDMIVIVPEASLETGAYSLAVHSDSELRPVLFGVGLPSDLQDRQSAVCVDEYLYTVARPQGFQGWNQWLSDVTNMEQESTRRTAGGNPVLAVSTKPCSVLDEVAKERIHLPSHIEGIEASVLRGWLLFNPSLRPAEATDCGCDQDLAAIRQSWENPNPYYVEADFNKDGEEDFAVVLVDAESEHQWGWNAALVVFNGPLHGGMAPAFFKQQIGTLQGSLLYHSSTVPLLVGPWESEGLALQPNSNSYVLQ